MKMLNGECELKDGSTGNGENYVLWAVSFVLFALLANGMAAVSPKGLFIQISGKN
jgi:hypothetical protein